MSLGSVIGGTFRAILIAAATGAAAFGLLVVLQLFGRPAPAPTALTVTGTPQAAAMQGRIESLRIALRETEAALEAARTAPPSAPSPDAALRGQYEAQIAAATERRNLALRHAEAIRASLEAGVTPSSLAEIRDSVVIGQLLTQQVTLDAQIAVEGARLKAGHPTMRALTAQRTALAGQIRQEAANIAAALESEARIDDAQIELLEAQLPALAAATPAAATDTVPLERQAAAQRSELDGLVDAYFNIPPAVAVTSPASDAGNPLSLANLAVVAVAAMVAILFQVGLALRRRRAAAPSPADIAAWEADDDPEVAIVVPQVEPLRKAS